MVLYKSSKQPVISPIKLNEVQTLMVAEQVPSAAALELSEATKNQNNKSHLIIESPSMGMLMRYIIEQSDFKTEIDFCTEVQVTEGVKNFTFDFQDMLKWR